MDNADEYIQRRVWLCIANSVSYAVWQGLQFGIFERAPLATPVSLLGALVWVITLVMLLAPLVQKRGAGGGDERIARNGLRAMAAGYWCMVVAVALFVPLSIFAQLGLIDLARAFAIVAVASPVFAFALLERIDDRA